MKLRWPSSGWVRSVVDPLHKRLDKASERPKMFLQWRRRKSTVSVTDDEELAPPAVMPTSVDPSIEATPSPKQKVAVPVKIPLEHLYKRETFVGGKKIPYTRLQTKQRRMRMIIYDRIHEDKAVHVF
ncbi:hypothetical protein H310_02975 [Aphanomyces invadans]|uniref:Uncharacterized protein n=1 Tax=Aphanomyces invadans TaxID=157072 RepID=A0A024UMJ7_9STRA|nr:hypothetical protein H310_02975 [Aphanomyces invadans]ETW06838.1 hypothetical protein H310_02975 [Aphanomyces invadans]|eukprot:XP_008864913.1 hypothetical protein H310_02975 [Aphanomyces invadans]